MAGRVSPHVLVGEDGILTLGHPSCHWHWNGRAGGEAVKALPLVGVCFATLSTITAGGGWDTGEVVGEEVDPPMLGQSDKDLRGRALEMTR